MFKCNGPFARTATPHRVMALSTSLLVQSGDGGHAVQFGGDPSTPGVDGNGTFGRTAPDATPTTTSMVTNYSDTPSMALWGGARLFAEGASQVCVVASGVRSSA